MRQGWTVGAIFGLAALLVAGCAPMRDQTSETVTFKTEPAGATVAVKGAGKCSTPCTLTMTRGEAHVAEVSKKGCYPTRMIVAPVADDYKRMLTFIDAYFGSGYELKPNPANLKLNCGG